MKNAQIDYSDAWPDYYSILSGIQITFTRARSTYSKAMT